jgi:hypothetical protein
VPVVVTLAPIFEVPVTLSVPISVIAPFKSKLPVILKFFAPSTAANWMVVPVKFIYSSVPLNVTVPEYV